jgi:hypothetical protein
MKILMLALYSSELNSSLIPDNCPIILSLNVIFDCQCLIYTTVATGNNSPSMSVHGIEIRTVTEATNTA